MNFINIKSILLVSLAFLLLGTQSCKIDEIDNPNGADVDAVENNATLSDMITLTKGIESSSRLDIGFYYTNVGVIGRDFYRLTSTDPAYTGTLVGASGADLGNDFLLTRPYSSRYGCIRNCYTLKHAVENNVSGVTDAQKKGFLGFASTFRAYQLMLVANLTYCTGIRVDTEDPENLGPFVGESNINEAYAAIETILNDANDQLADAEFAFTLSSGFPGGVDGFKNFNRALAARAAIYQGKKQEALNYLNDAAPFFSLSLDEELSFQHVFTKGAGDIECPLFFVPNGPDNITVQQDWIDNIETGDSRAAPGNKYQERTSTLIIDGTGLSGDYDVLLWNDREAPIGITNSSEMLLIYAEALIGSNNTEAADALNTIRNKAGLANAVYANTPPTDLELVDQLLHERRYSLYAEGHRWVDMRRYNRLDQIATDNVGDRIHECFPRPDAEIGG